ncbi:MAG: hypothetical protein KDA22_03185 [Phycisphaerales bacterium]|nr:hypothetical protein [Phycisphaerales bacterium]
MSTLHSAGSDPVAGMAYRHSGRIPLFGWLTFPGALVVAVVVGYLYGWINVLNPFVGWLSVFVVGGAVIVTGAVIGMMLSAAKVRSNGIATLVGLVGGAALLYVAWASFASALVARHGSDGARLPFLTALTHPQVVVDLGKTLYDQGWFTIRRHTVTGPMLAGGWVVEACGLMLGTAWLVRRFIADRVFSERANEWVTGQPLKVLPAPDEAGMSRLTEGHFELLTTTASGTNSFPAIVVTGYEHHGDPDFRLLEIKRVVAKPPKKKGAKPELNETVVVPPTFVDPKVYAAVLATAAPKDGGGAAQADT